MATSTKIETKKTTVKKQVKKPIGKSGAPKGNRFWTLRSTHGRKKIFGSPKILWEAACEYFEYCESTPLIEIDFKGKNAKRVELPKMRAFTIQGLCLYLGVNSVYFNDFRAAIKKKTKEEIKPVDEDFSEIITRIYETIYTQKFEGAAAGFLNPNIIARDLGLANKIENQQLDENGQPIAPKPPVVINLGNGVKPDDEAIG